MGFCLDEHSSNLFSRAVDSDEEIEEEDVQSFDLNIIWTQEPEISLIKNLVISTGPDVSEYLKVCLSKNEKSEVIGSIENLSKGLPKKKNSSDIIYKNVNKASNDCSIIILCQVKVPMELLFQWTKKVFKTFFHKEIQITVLSTSNVGNYKSNLPPGDLPSNFSRILSTTNISEKSDIKILEQPNLLTGLEAQILSYCEFNDIKCRVITTYYNFFQFEISTVKTFDKILNALGIVTIKEKDESMDELKKFYLKTLSNFNNIYL